MHFVRKAVWVIALSAALGACALPRGAALQSEIINAGEGEDASFAVYPVTRETLPTLQNWYFPSPSKGWISHRHSGGAALIKPNDVVTVTIWDSDENSLLTAPNERRVELSNIVVSQQGSIFLPYLGNVRISGMSPEGARRKLQNLAEGAIPSAQIQLAVEPGTRQTVDLVSGVASPGAFPITDKHFTVLNLISQGGGVSKELRNPQISLTRAGKRYATPLRRVLENPSLDTVLRSGDKVALIEDERYFRALGATDGDALHYFETDEITALDAVSIIGGLTASRANPKGILILREYPSRWVRSDGSGPSHARSIFVVDLTSADGTFSAGKFKIAPEDTVLVTESAVGSARTVLGLIGSVFGLATAVD